MIITIQVYRIEYVLFKHPLQSLPSNRLMTLFHGHPLNALTNHPAGGRKSTSAFSNPSWKDRPIGLALTLLSPECTIGNNLH